MRTDRRADQNVLSLRSAPDAIELRHLRSFVVVADELNFTRAAARLFLSPPALSRQIRALERLVGCQLFRRSTRRVELTLSGKELLDRARGLLRDLDEAITATQAVGGELTARLTQLWKPVTAVAPDLSDIRALRGAFEQLHAQFDPLPDVEVRPTVTGGVHGLELARGQERLPTVLYLHGGGYVMGSAFGYRHLTSAFAAAADAAVLVPDYRLAPEHPFPAALDDVATAYRWMLANTGDERCITVAGDSAGAGLVVSLLLHLRRESVPLPGRAVLLSPWVDLWSDHDQQRDEYWPPITNDQLRWFAASYAAEGGDERLDPLRADLSSLPPMLIQAGQGDILVRDAYLLADRARSHGVAVELEVYPAATHDFHVFWSFLPEAADALRRAGEYVQAGSI